VLNIYGDGNDTSEFANKQAMDPYGNIYIVGGYNDQAGVGKNRVMKFDAYGALLRIDEYTSEHFIDIEADSTGIYLATQTGWGLGVIKCDHNGNRLWNTSYDPGYNYQQFGSFQLAIDPFHNVYGCMPLDTSLLLLKLDEQGQLQWVEQGQLPGEWDWRVAMKTDKWGNVIVGGAINISGPSTEYTVAKFSPYGDLQWLYLDQGTYNYADHVNDIEVDADGNVYATGLQNYQGEFSNSVTVKLKSWSGALLWKQVYNNPAGWGDEMFDVLVAKDGSVYVTGAEDSYQRHTTVIKYDNDGNHLWKLNFGDSLDEYHPMYTAEDAGGNLIIAGRHWAQGTLWAGTDLFAASISANGSMNWLDICKVDNAGEALGLNIHPQGGAYVATRMQDKFNHKTFGNIGLIKYGTAAPLSVPSVTSNAGFDIHPNPAQDNFIVSIDEAGNMLIEVSDLSGRVVQQVMSEHTAKNVNVDVSKLPAGAYTIRARGEKIHTVKKLVVAR